MEINVDTKLVLFLGEPLRQSISTRILNRIYEYLGLNVIRISVEVSGQDSLRELLAGMRHMNLAGFNVTKPNKIAILPFLDELDPLAEKIGAVNCVVCQDNKWKGYNTDAEGFLQALKESTPCRILENKFFCFGAGGAGRAICFGLAAEGAGRIYLADVFDKAADSLEDRINRYYPGVARKIPFSQRDRIEETVNGCDVVINASGMGMAPHLEETPVRQEVLHTGQIIFDATYNPPKTRFLREAERQGCFILNGEKMLMNCNMIGFEKICGIKAPVDKWKEIMREESRRI